MGMGMEMEMVVCRVMVRVMVRVIGLDGWGEGYENEILLVRRCE